MSKKVNTEPIPGVYKITCGSSVYYGRSKNCRTRHLSHLGMLRNGNHHNPRLQNSFNRGNNLYFNVIYPELELDLQPIVEQCLINTYPNCNVNSAFEGVERTPEVLNKFKQSTSGYRHYSYSDKKYKFVNSSRDSHLLTRTEAKKVLGLSSKSLSLIIRGKQRVAKGWAIGTYPANSFKGREIVLSHLITKELFKGLQSEAVSSLGINSSNLNKLIKGERNHVKKWKLEQLC